MKPVKLKQQQWLILGGIVVGLVVVGIIIVESLKGESIEPGETLPDNAFHTPVTEVDTSHLWEHHVQDSLQQLQKNHQRAVDDMAQLRAINDALGEKLESVNSDSQSLRDELALLKQQQLTAVETTSTVAPDEPSPALNTQKKNTSHQLFDEAFHASPEELLGALPQQIFNGEIKEDEATKIKTPENFIPAGSFAEAVLLGSADAGASALSQSNPKPMLLRVVGEAHLPNGYHNRLTDCLITAAVVGDISAERGAIRLERLSCVLPSGKVIEQTIEGTVFGHDGKNGLRGKPVWREGPMVARSAVAGFFGGIGQGVESRFTPQAALATQANQLPSTGQIVGRGAGSGLHNAFDRVADYNIKRAELYHPIIQLSAGVHVDVVFLKGFFIDETMPVSAAPQLSKTTRKKSEDEAVNEAVGDIFKQLDATGEQA